VSICRIGSSGSHYFPFNPGLSEHCPKEENASLYGRFAQKDNHQNRGYIIGLSTLKQYICTDFENLQVYRKLLQIFGFPG
jgi:hypothetical protein